MANVTDKKKQALWELLEVLKELSLFKRVQSAIKESEWATPEAGRVVEGFVAFREKNVQKCIENCREAGVPETDILETLGADADLLVRE